MGNRFVTLNFDARISAKAPTCSIGGYVSHPSFGHRWFRQSFRHSDFVSLGIDVQAEMQREISCYEALAQAALILAASSLLPCCNIPIRLKSLSDNSGAESGINKCWTTSRPLAYFLERISLVAAVHRVSLDVSHIPGEENKKADALSHPEEYALPLDCLPHERLAVDLQSL